jgi:hypothetical protein
MIKNLAGQSIQAGLIDKSSGDAVTSGTVTVYLTKDGGIQAAGVGTVEHEGRGQWSYFPTQSETNASVVAFLFTHTSAISANLTVYPRTGTDYVAGVPTAGGVEPITWRQLITDSLVEINVYSPDESPSDAHIEIGRRTLNRIINTWQALQGFAYSVSFQSFTFTAAHQPHLMSPGLSSPDLAAARPVRIESGSVLVGTDYVPIQIVDKYWWSKYTSKSLTGPYPFVLFYSPDNPSGSIYVAPIPTANITVVLELWTSLQQIATADLGTYFVAPYGYEDAVMLTLSEKICRVMMKKTPASLVNDARKARAIILRNSPKDDGFDKPIYPNEIY